MTLPQDIRAPISQQRWIEWKNVGSQEAPGFAALEVTASTLDGVRHYFSAKRPTEASLKQLAFNSAVPVAAGSYGVLTFDLPTFVLYDSAATPAVGEQWGSQADSFLLKEHNAGVLILGGVDSSAGIVRVGPLWAGGGVLWRFSLNEDMDGGDAAADLIELDGTDTGRDVTVSDPEDAFDDLANGDTGYCFQQGDLFIVIQAPC
jgi:hypothetical protein